MIEPAYNWGRWLPQYVDLIRRCSGEKYDSLIKSIKEFVHDFICRPASNVSENLEVMYKAFEEFRKKIEKEESLNLEYSVYVIDTNDVFKLEGKYSSRVRAIKTANTWSKGGNIKQVMIVEVIERQILLLEGKGGKK